ncbi:hypothetical protein [Saccharomonospora iraqiensis]|uniref:hypothetical protein n=1 Tax=Saccharomonospora iraqiensis TaxID=52698 RepID=UPI00022E6E99|nr:hypothetical protein [Saccharomonospora iraqiensis]
MSVDPPGSVPGPAGGPPGQDWHGGLPQAAPVPVGPAPADPYGLPPQRPATVTAAAVLGFLAAALELVGGLAWMLGGAVLGSMERVRWGETGFSGVIVVLGVAALVAAGAYLWGGVAALRGRQVVLLVAAGVGAAVNLVAVITFGTGGLGLVLAAVLILLLSLAPSRNYRPH